MRIKYLLLFGILLSITAAVYTATTTTTTTKKPTAKSTITKSAKTRTESALKTTTTNANTKNARNAKSLKTAPGEKRGKRTLYDFGNPGYIYSDIASRRAGYVSDNDAQQNSYNNYPQNGYFNGQNAIAQFPGQFGGYSGYPQYLEAPEPIIEIIIKDSNETLPTEPPQPIVTKKKKKEKVHVFYVNYKKDENNKLHLESPIASLNNDDTEEEEEEQIVQIPSAVTPPPTYRTTTLRTIIHPDSEKFHSNSGIHVTFGSADKKQRGHELEESDAESIQSQVIALPLTGSPNVGSHGKSEHLYANTRADFGVARAPSGNYINQSPYYHVPQQQQSNYYQTQQGQQQQQQLPQAHSTTLFRQQPAVSAPAHTKLNSKPKPQQQQQQYQQQRPHFLPTIPPATSSHQQQSSSSSGVFGKLLQQSNYYVNHNQQYPSYTTPRNQYYQTQTSTPRPTSAPKQSIFFPTSPPKQQELPSRQTPAPYQPVKFRPTSSTPQQSKPLKLQNTGYQTLQQQHQQYYQHKQQQQQQTQQYQPQPQQQQQSQYQAQPQQQQHQYQPQQQQELPTKSQPFQFNRQPQYVQQPTFTVPSPNLPSSSSSQTNYYQKQQSQSQFHNSQQSSQKPSSNTRYQSQQNVAQPQAAAGLSTLHNYFDIKPSKETELLKSIPKFEQHITETIHHSGSQQHVQRTVYNPQTSFQTQNQVIHDVPAPNLGPTHKPQQSAANHGASGHYITASNLNSQQQPQAQPLQQQQQQPQQQQQHSATQSQYSNFVAAQNYASSTQSPQFESTNGQKIMIVTPMPPINYQQYHSSQYTGANQGGSNYVQQQQQHHQQNPVSHNTNNFGIDPRQPASASIGSINNVHQDGSEYSVSTHHADVFKELERRKQQHQEQQQQQQYQQYEYSQNTQPQSTQKLYSTASSERPLPASSTSTTTPTTKTPSNGQQVPPSLLQLPDEVPDDLRQQLLSSGILNNADISVLDYDKVGDIALENLPAEHLQHFYGAGGGAQISESNKVVTAVKPNGDSVALSEKDIERVKQTNALPQKHNLDLKVVRFNSQNEKSIADKYVKSDATVVSPVDLASNQYNRYLPLKINGAQFPIPNSDELNGKKVVSVVVLAPVESTANSETATITGSTRSQRDEAAVDAKEVKFLGGDLIKTLVKKPTKENFKRWLDKEAHTEVEQQSVVLLVAKSSDSGEQEIFMYDISTGSVNKLNGELSSAFVNVAEENASSEDLEHASTLDPSFLDTMMMTSPQRR